MWEKRIRMDHLLSAGYLVEAGAISSSSPAQIFTFFPPHTEQVEQVELVKQVIWCRFRCKDVWYQ